MKKKYLVIGAGGFIGNAVVRTLLNNGHDVTACMRFKPENPVQEALFACGASIRFAQDVSSSACLEEFQVAYKKKNYDGIVYSIGHCPPNGFIDAIRHPLSTLPLKTLDREYKMHQRGVVNTFQAFLDSVVPGGCFLFISSAITRLTDEHWPNPNLQFHYHCAMIAAEDWLIRGMRFDPKVQEYGIKIHRIAPGAVETPFHQGGPRPPAMLSLEEVAEGVANALASEVVVDRVLAPAAPTPTI